MATRDTAGKQNWDDVIAVSGVEIIQIGFVRTLSDDSPLVSFWGFRCLDNSKGKSYTVGQLRAISGVFWVHGIPPELEGKIKEAVELGNRRIEKGK